MILPPLHKLNTGFSWPTRQHNTLRRLAVEEISNFDEHGYIIVNNVLSADELATLIPIIDRLESRETETVLTMEGHEPVKFTASQMTFACNLACENQHLRAMASSPLMCDLMHDLIGPDVRLYWDQAVYKKPNNATNFTWHQDNGYTFIEPQDYITCWLALTDADASNGCPWVLPGLHRYGTFAHDQSKEGLAVSGLDQENIADRALCTPLKAGDMVVFSSLTPHMTGPNLTGKTRKAMILQYCTDSSISVNSNGHREPLNNPHARFPILKDGRPLTT